MGEGEKTVKIMKRIAKMNGKEVSIEQKNAISDGCSTVVLLVVGLLGG